MAPWRPLPLPNLAPERAGASVHATLVSQLNALQLARNAAPDYHVALGRYVDWISSAETQFRSLFTGEEVVAALHTPRYWFLLGLGPSAEPWRIFYDEVDLQTAIIEQYANQLKHEMEVFQLDEGEQAVVLDTNFFLHYQQIDHIVWSELLPGRRHRIVIPAVVIKELDDKKYHPNRSLSRPAWSTIRLLSLIRGEAHPEESIPLPGRPSVRVQILLDPAGHQRAMGADDELLSRAEHLASVVGSHLVVGSADYGMHLGSSVRGLKFWRPDESLRRSTKDDAEGVDDEPGEGVDHSKRHDEIPSFVARPSPTWSGPMEFSSR